MTEVSFHDLRETSAPPEELFARSAVDLTSFCVRARPIIEAVKLDGGTALQRFARAYDGVSAHHMSLRAEPAEFADAERLVPADVVAAIKHASDNIRRVHEVQKPPKESGPFRVLGHLRSAFLARTRVVRC